MSEARKSSPLASTIPLWQNWLLQGFVAIYLLAAMLAFIFIPMLASSWVDLPFIGAFVEHTMVFNGNDSAIRPSPWSARNQGLVTTSQLVAIDGQAVHDSSEMRNVLSEHTAGDTVRLGVHTQDNLTKEYSVQLINLPVFDRRAYLIFPYLIGLVYLASGVWVFLLRRRQTSGRAFAVFVASVAVVTGGLFDLYTTHRLTFFWMLALALGGASIVELALTFPREERLIVKYPILRFFPYLLAIGLTLYTYPFLFNFSQPFAYIPVWQIGYIVDGICLMVALGWFIYRRVRASSPVEREQLRFILIGLLVGLGPVGLWFIGVMVWGVTSLAFTPYLLFFLVVFPLATGYAIQRYQLLNTDFILSQVALYGLMAILIVIGYSLLVAGLGLLLNGLVPPNSPMLTGLVMFLLAMLVIPLRNALSNAVDAVFFRGEQAYQERLQALSSELTSSVEMGQIIRALRNTINQSLKPNRLHLYIYDPLSELYTATMDEQGRRTSDLRFPMNSGLIQMMQNRKSTIFLDGRGAVPEELRSEQTRIQLLAAQVFVPLPGRQRMSGWMALGARLSGENYSSREVSFIESLSDQAALAIERAQVVVNMENRVREMNVLARVAQGINITLKLDDILELIYAQTSQIIQSDDFHILLFDRESGALMEIFYVENGDRLSQFENRPVISGQSLEQEVIRQRRSVLTDDYTRECQQRGILPAKGNMYAWMGVPLNAGAETIGALSLAKHDPSGTFTREQLNLMQAISDQVAGAIVKARLLEETERRARQLATLNEVTRQLSSTLEPAPLLRNILQSAVDILECEAGSLLMVDEQTDELVFEVTVGPVADDLINRRLPPGSGVVGKAVANRHAVIVNNVQGSANWFAKTDQQTGFTTRTLLAVPLQVKDRVLGVIEVINKLDGSPFIRDDEDLLSAFAAQAAVALENAHLYTLTDQALAARVEELSVMQRIDRELNASLDTGRAMRITLEWAARQAHSDAGFVGMTEDDTLRIIASQGYTDELASYQETPMAMEKYHFIQAVDSGSPISLLIPKDIESGVLAEAQRLVAIPIRRETSTMGLVVLEFLHSEPMAEDTLNFLLRLSDHAAIAISNAQLYAAVQAANVAKSEFVSFVSHELKNPMTSIKGYSELLAKGAVGPINDAQANFLATIRSNVERMATLVTDLADVSRIEAGKLKLEFKALKLAEVVDEVIRSLQRQIDEKSQHLVLELPADLPQVWSDRTRILQVITNLVSNAYKYTPTDGMIYVAAEVCDNQWDPEGAKHVVHFWVRDTGIGIAPEDQRKIFQKFFRSEDAETRKAPGTGLGLNITRSLVEMQGGKIWFESEFRKGTTFHFTAPVAE